MPDEVSLHLTRTPFVPVEVSLDLARLVSEHETLGAATQALTAVAPEVVAYACASGSFVGGIAGERAMCAAMEQSGEMPALTTSGALLEALREIGAERIALVTPYTSSVTRSLHAYLDEGGISVTGCAFLGLTRHIWKVPYRDVVEMARRAVVDSVDALFISCTNLPTYDVIPQLEAELRMPVLSANQVTMWAALRRIGERAVGPYQALLDPVARRGPASMSALPPPPSQSPEPPVPTVEALPPLPIADESGMRYQSGDRGEPEAALAGAGTPGGSEAEAVEGGDLPPYPEESGGSAGS